MESERAAATIRVEVIEAWPREYRSRRLVLPVGASVGDALEAAGIARDAYPAVAVFGERVRIEHSLADGDRVELLRPLQADPKDSRRRRAEHRRNAGNAGSAGVT